MLPGDRQESQGWLGGPGRVAHALLYRVCTGDETAMNEEGGKFKEKEMLTTRFDPYTSNTSNCHPINVYNYPIL